MDYLVMIIGVLIVVVLMADVVYTAFVPSGAGLLTKWSTRAVWKVFYILSGKRGKARILIVCGATTLLVILSIWILLFWLGNFLIVAAYEGSVVDAITKEPVGLWDKAYFIGYNLSTMGNGDLMAATNAYRIYISAVSFSGLILITSAVTYFIPVIQADNHKRTISGYVNSLGDNPLSIISNAWNGKDLRNLEKPFQELNLLIIDLMQQHIDYPVVNNFHTTVSKKSVSVNLAIVDETIHIIQSSIPQEHTLSAHVVTSLKKAIAGYAGSLQQQYIKPSKEAPGIPMAGVLKNHGIPVKQSDQEAFYNRISLRRRLLLAYLEDEGWSWDDVWSELPLSDLEKTNF